MKRQTDTKVKLWKISYKIGYGVESAVIGGENLANALNLHWGQRWPKFRKNKFYFKVLGISKDGVATCDILTPRGESYRSDPREIKLHEWVINGKHYKLKNKKIKPR